jgi:hypothetical protein
MLSAHIASFLKLIGTQIEETITPAPVPVLSPALTALFA